MELVVVPSEEGGSDAALREEHAARLWSSPSGFGTRLSEYMQTYLIGRGEGGKAAPVFL